MRTLLLPSYKGPVVDFRIARLSVRVMTDREIPEHRSVGATTTDAAEPILSGVEGRKPAFQIGFEIVDIFQSDMEP